MRSLPRNSSVRAHLIGSRSDGSFSGRSGNVFRITFQIHSEGSRYRILAAIPVFRARKRRSQRALSWLGTIMVTGWRGSGGLASDRFCTRTYDSVVRERLLYI